MTQDLADRLEKARNDISDARKAGAHWELIGDLRINLDRALFNNLDTILASLRAVAPAPADQSDAGRDGVVTGLMLAAQMTLKRADSELQCAIDFEADGYALGAEKCRATAEEFDRLRLDLLEAASGQKSDIVNPQWNPAFMRAMTAKSVVILIADRDAIREALKLIRQHLIYGRGSVSETAAKAAVTAALALIGEG